MGRGWLLAEWVGELCSALPSSVLPTSIIKSLIYEPKSSSTFARLYIQSYWRSHSQLLKTSETSSASRLGVRAAQVETLISPWEMPDAMGKARLSSPPSHPA